MKIKTLSLACATLCAGAMTLRSASALDVNLGIGVDTPRPVVVQPAPVATRRWIPDQVVRREERVLVEPSHMRRRQESVLVEPARRVSKEERVLIAPERIERRSEQVLVRPATVVREFVPPETAQVRVGPVFVQKTIKEGYYREVPVPAVYETVSRDVVSPAKYDVVVRDVEIPARYETRWVEVPAPPRYETVMREVVIPGHYEEAYIAPPPVVVQPPSRPGLEIDIDLSKKKRRD